MSSREIRIATRKSALALWQAEYVKARLEQAHPGIVVTLVPMVMCAHPGTKYGVPFPVLARSAFGVRGANLPALLRCPEHEGPMTHPAKQPDHVNPNPRDPSLCGGGTCMWGRWQRRRRGTCHGVECAL